MQVATETAGVDETSLRYEGWRVVAASGAGVFGAAMFIVTFAVFLKPLAEEFGWSREAISSAYAGMTLASAFVSPFIGHLSDRFGPTWITRPSLLAGGCAFASLASLTSNLWHLYATFLVIGVALSGTSPVIYTRALTTWFDRRRGMALAAMISCAALAGILMPPLAQVLIDRWGWRGAYGTLGVATIVLGAPVVLRFVRQRSVSLLDVTPGRPSIAVRDAIRSRIFWTLVAVVFGTTLTLNAVLVHLAALLTDRGLAAGEAVGVASAMGVASLAGRLLTGSLLDRFLATRVAFALLLIAASGTFILATTHSFPLAILAAALIGFGTGGEADTVPYLLSRYFGLRSLAMLYGLHWTAFGVAGAVGPILMGRAFDATGSYQSILLGFGATTLAVAMLVPTLPLYQESH